MKLTSDIRQQLQAFSEKLPVIKVKEAKMSLMHTDVFYHDCDVLPLEPKEPKIFRCQIQHVNETMLVTKGKEYHFDQLKKAFIRDGVKGVEDYSKKIRKIAGIK